MSMILLSRVWTFIASSKSTELSLRLIAMLRKSESEQSRRRPAIPSSKRWSLIVRRKGLSRCSAAARSEMPFCFCQLGFDGGGVQDGGIKCLTCAIMRSLF